MAAGVSFSSKSLNRQISEYFRLSKSLAKNLPSRSVEQHGQLVDKCAQAYGKIGDMIARTGGSRMSRPMASKWNQLGECLGQSKAALRELQTNPTLGGLKNLIQKTEMVASHSLACFLEFHAMELRKSSDIEIFSEECVIPPLPVEGELLGAPDEEELTDEEALALALQLSVQPLETEVTSGRRKSSKQELSPEVARQAVHADLNQLGTLLELGIAGTYKEFYGPPESVLEPCRISLENIARKIDTAYGADQEIVRSWADVTGAFYTGGSPEQKVQNLSVKLWAFLFEVHAFHLRKEPSYQKEWNDKRLPRLPDERPIAFSKSEKEPVEEELSPFLLEEQQAARDAAASWQAALFEGNFPQHTEENLAEQAADSTATWGDLKAGWAKVVESRHLQRGAHRVGKIARKSARNAALLARKEEQRQRMPSIQEDQSPVSPSASEKGPD